MMRAAVVALLLLAPAASGLAVPRSAAPGHAVAESQKAEAPLGNMQGELEQIRKADSEHTQKLLFIAKLREALRLRLSAEDEKLAAANSKIATKISSIMHGQQLAETAALLE